MRSISFLILFASLTGCGINADKLTLEQNSGANALMEPDDDSDGYGASTDCDDADANPGEVELCDEVDNDCDGDIDDADSSVTQNLWAPDWDGDGFTLETGYVFACDVTSFADFVDAAGGDSSSLAYWSQVTQYEDTDGDGYEDTPSWDCDDEESAVYPGAEEVCDDMVNDCNAAEGTVADDGLAFMDYYMDMDSDGYGDATMSMNDCAAPDGYVEDNTDCDDTDGGISPGDVEICDEFDTDEDCDTFADDDDSSATGMTTWYPDMDSDGAGGDDSSSVDMCEQPSGYYAENTDCDDNDGSVIVETSWYYDGDGDGEGDESIATTPSCHAPTNYVDSYGDCDDANAAVNTDAVEVVNGIDDNCRDGIDEGVSCTVELNIFTDDAGAALWINGMVSDNVDLDGDWSVSDGASLWSTSVTSLGGSDWFYSIQFDHCLDSSTVITLEAEFADGTTFAESGTVYAWEDSDLLSVAGSGGTLSVTE